MSQYRLVITFGAFIGVIGFLLYFIFSLKAKRVSIYQNQRVSDGPLWDIFSSLIIVKYWRLKKQIQLREEPTDDMMSDLKILRMGLISSGVLLLGVTIQIVGMLGKAGKL